MRGGCDTVLACGGDGTVHEVLQRLVGGTTALGVIPMGTANALAAGPGAAGLSGEGGEDAAGCDAGANLGGASVLSHAWKAASARVILLLRREWGRTHSSSRGLDSRLKQRFGYIVYLVEAFRLWATYTFPMFTASLMESGRETPREVGASQLLAVRISNFRSLDSERTARRGRPSATKLRVIAFKTFSRVRYLRFLIAVLFGRHRYAHTIELVKCISGRMPEPGGIGGAVICGGRRRAAGPTAGADRGGAAGLEPADSGEGAEPHHGPVRDARCLGRLCVQGLARRKTSGPRWQSHQVCMRSGIILARTQGDSVRQRSKEFSAANLPPI